MAKELAPTRQNLFTNSATQDNWTAGGIGVPGPTVTPNFTLDQDGQMSATKIEAPAVSSAGNVSYSARVMLTSPHLYWHSFSVYLKGDVGGEKVYIAVTSDGISYYGTTLCTLTTTWQRYYLVAQLPALNNFFTIGTDRRDSGQLATPAQTYYIGGTQLVRTNYPGPYTLTTSSAYNTGNLMLLGTRPIAPTQQNLFRFSNDTSNAVWSAVNSSIPSRNNPDHNGLLRATKVVDNTATSTKYASIGLNPTPKTGMAYTVSCKVKAAELSACYLNVSNGVDANYTNKFDLANGLAGGEITFNANSPAIGSGIIPIRNGWYLVWMSFRMAAGRTVNSAQVGLLGSFAQTSASYTGAGNQGIYFCDMNLSQGIGFPPDYYETTSSLYDIGAVRNIAPRQQNFFKNTNLASTDWVKQATGDSVIPVITANQPDPEGGTKAFRCQFQVNTSGVSMLNTSNAGTVITSRAYYPQTSSFWARTRDGSTKNFLIQDVSASVVGQPITVGPTWGLVNLTMTPIANGSVDWRLYLSKGTTSDSADIDIFKPVYNSGNHRADFVETYGSVYNIGTPLLLA